MDITPLLKLPCGANTEKGYPSSIDVSGTYLLYCTGPSIAILNFANLEDSDIFREHTARTCCVSASPNGSMVISADIEGNLKVWSLSNKEHPVAKELSIAGVVRTMRWSFDSERIVAVGDRCSKVFIASTGNTIGEIGGHSRNMITCDFKPSRPFRILTAGEDFQINVHSGPPFKYDSSRKDHTGYVNCVRFNDDGTKVLSVSSDRKAYVYSFNPFEVLYPLEAHTGSILSGDWANDDRVVTAGTDSIKVWNGPNLERSIDCSCDVVGLWANNEQFIALGLDGVFNFWQFHSDAPSMQFVNSPKAPKAMCFLGEDLITGDVSGYLVSRKNPMGELLHIHESPIVTVKASASQIASIDINKNVMLVNGSDKSTASVTETPLDAGYDPAGVLYVLTAQNIACVNNGEVTNIPVQVNSAKLIGLTDTHFYVIGGAKLHRISKGGDTENSIELDSEPSTLSVSPNMEIAALGCNNGKVLLFSLPSLEKIKTFDYQSAKINSLHFSHDGVFVASGSLDKTICAWRIDTGNRWQVRDAHRGGVISVQFSPSGTLFSSGSDNVIRTWALS